MKLHNLSRRDRFYNQGDSYKLVPILRMPVCPGTSVNIKGTIKFQTAAFTQNILTGAIASVFVFYVPHRLVWDEWPDFISQADDYAGTFPTTSTNWAWCFDRNQQPQNHSALFRRAYKLCYNQYFGQKGGAGAGTKTWYADITADTVVDEHDILNSEQWSARLMLDSELKSPTYDATTVPIDLNEFYRQMMSARSARRANMSGDKYVDALRRMGVEPDWRIQLAPEFLGRVDKDVFPVVIVTGKHQS